MPVLTRTCAIVLIASAGLLPCPVTAVDRTLQGPSFEDNRLLIRVVPRTPEQIAAFYEARGFPPAALERIRQTCFVTVFIKNKGNDVLWLDLDHWSFSRDGEPLALLDDEFWQTQWDAIGLRQASRSTFGWTRLPRVRDLQHDEPVGGNVAFPGTTRALEVEAVFQTGADRKGAPVRLGLGRVPCMKSTAQP